MSKSYGSAVVLKSVNLTVSEGEFVSIRGKSGVGTSLFKIFEFLELHSGGSVRLFGKNADALNDGEYFAVGQLGLIFQFFNLLPSLTVLRILSYR